MKSVTYGIGGFDKTKPNDNIVEEIEITNLRRQPLNDVGVLTTLLVVVGVITLQDGANAVKREPADLVAEAQAWAIAEMDQH